ncbi:MAG TPA: P-loop NTPase, partial [Myxococcota bacterium]|nr:P-loop NTPase [Myxococcota bacterium]
MTDKLSFAVLALDDAARTAIGAGLSATGAIRVVAGAARPEDLEPALRGAARVGLYLDLGGEPDKALGWIEALAEPKPAVLAGGPNEPALILRAMRAGALAYFPDHAFDAELARVAMRLQEQAAAHAPARAGRAIAVLGAKGGVGTTTIACELAAALARPGARTALLDAKAYFGDVALHLDFTPSHTLADVASRADDLDAAYLATVAQRHELTGVHVVAAPASPEDADAIAPGHVQRSLELLKSEFAYVVVDLPRITDEAALACLDRADLILLVTTAEVPALARARQHAALLDQLGHSPDKIRVVANRCGRPGVLADEDPLRAVGLAPAAYLPDEASAASDALASGRPIAVVAPRSTFAAARAGLVDEVRVKESPAGDSFTRTSSTRPARAAANV